MSKPPLVNVMVDFGLTSVFHLWTWVKMWVLALLPSGNSKKKHFPVGNYILTAEAKPREGKMY